MPPLRDLTNGQVVRAFLRMGAASREGARHTVVYFRGHKLVFPRGKLKTGLVMAMLKRAGLTVEEFSDHL